MDFNSPVGVVLLIFSILISLYAGYHASKLADLYAVPFFSGLVSFSILAWTAELLGIHDKFYIREALEFFAFIFGLYIGM